ncbi:arsenic resistance N-acetyltransferase ArsN2 [Almyronema epifaneia]|uniref:Arsenic resistance N-acetyltransferase ArsN2 n=1 Tax=Almyronema epifaneia S1 TaxID=2991925 RepID=A0ABW6IKN5_9CYAN
MADIKPAHPVDEASIKQLLSEAALPHTDLKPHHLSHFIVAKSHIEQHVIGVVGVECYGQVGLLRSLAISQPHRRQNLGKRLVEKIEAYAQQQGVKTLYLLTTTAADYFRQLGYHNCDRQQVPPAIAETTEFRHFCPDSAACLVKALDDR